MRLLYLCFGIRAGLVQVIARSRSAAPGYDLIQHRSTGTAGALLLMRLFIIGGVWKIIPLSCHILELLAKEYLADDSRQNLRPAQVEACYTPGVAFVVSALIVYAS